MPAYRRRYSKKRTLKSRRKIYKKKTYKRKISRYSNTGHYVEINAQKVMTNGTYLQGDTDY